MPAISTPMALRSVVRHRPINPDVQEQEWVAAPTLRASRTKPHTDPHSTGGPPSVHGVLQRHRSLSIGMAMLLALLLLWVGHGLWMLGQQIADSVQYGMPRTFQIDRFVGHETDPHMASHFVAINEGGQVYIWELPGNPAASRVLLGLQLTGPNAALVPVTLAFAGDPHHPDLLIQVDGLQVRFHNTGTSYVGT